MVRKKKETAQETLEKYRHTPEQHATEYLKHAKDEHSAHNILRLVAALQPLPWVLHDVASEHDIELSITVHAIPTLLRVRTSNDFGKTEVVVSQHGMVAHMTFDRPFMHKTIADALAASLKTILNLPA